MTKKATVQTQFAPRKLKLLPLAILAFFAGLALDVAAEAPRLKTPIQCAMGQDCFIQNYFDHDTGPGWRDYACGWLSYNGHHGTDFRLKNLHQMDEGVAVVAAAAGTVIAVRDGEPDISIRDRKTALRQGREAGNAVRIDHGEGWETQYSHLKKNSVEVRPGQKIGAGEKLGLVGLSGKTEFPHVHLTVRKDGRPIDPFSPDGNPQCGKSSATLWAEEDGPAIAYRATGLLNAGFSSSLPDRQFIGRGGNPASNFDSNAEAIIFFVEVFGVRTGDIEEMEVLAPDGRSLSRRQVTMDRNLAIRQMHLGKRRTHPWQVGEYQGRYVLRRAEKIVIDLTQKLSVSAVPH